MSLFINEAWMTSTASPHSARRLVDCGGWELSWLPDWLVDRNQAITGMILAQLGCGSTWSQMPAADQARLDDLADELGLTGAEALSLIASTPA